MIFSCTGSARAPSFSVSLIRLRFDAILTLLIGSPVKFKIAAPPTTHLCLCLERSLNDFEIAAEKKTCVSAVSIKNVFRRFQISH